MLRRTPSYPFRKPRDLSPEIRQRILDDEQKLATTRAKLAAEQHLTQEVSGAPCPPAVAGFAPGPRQAAQREEAAKGGSVPASSIQPPTSRTHPPEPTNDPQDEIKDEPSANFLRPSSKKSPGRSAVTKNAKQYLRAAPKF